MSAILYSISLQWKLDIRNKEILLTYYVVPLIFFLFMGGIFTSIMPDSYKTLMQSMTVFGVTMGAMLGSPSPLVDIYGSEIKKAYLVGGIPLWTATVSNFISAFIHLFIMSFVIFLIAPIAYGATVPHNLVTYFVSLSLFIASSLCIGTLFGLFVKSASKLTMLTQFVFLPSVMLSGVMFPVTMLPEALQYVGKIFPATWGYMLMTAEKFEVSNALPLFLVIAVSLLVSAIKLRKMSK